MKHAQGKHPSSHRFKYQQGAVVGSYGMVLLQRLGKLNGRQAGLFRCECGKTKVAKIGNVACGDTTSCGCRVLEVRRTNARKLSPEQRLANLAKIPREVLSANGRRSGRTTQNLDHSGRYSRANLAKIPREVLQANGRAAAAKLPKEIRRANGLQSSLNNSKHKREYRGTTYRNSWEVVVAAALATAGFRFDYERHIFHLGDLGTYTPDFYIPALNLWVEVKGRLRETAIAKYKDFARTHNSLLLRREALQLLYPKLGSVTRHSIEKIEAGVKSFAVLIEPEPV